MRKFGFRRNTHTRDGKYRADLVGEGCGCSFSATWQAVSGVLTNMTGIRPMSFNEIYGSVSLDRNHYRVEGPEHPIDEREPIPSRERVAQILVIAMENDLVEILPMPGEARSCGLGDSSC